MEQHHRTPIVEHRESTRFTAEPYFEFAVLWAGQDTEVMAEVHDESLTGMGLIVPRDDLLQIGQEVDIVYAGSYLRGTVRHLQPRADGTCLAGLQCERRTLPPRSAPGEQHPEGAMR